MVFVIFVIPVMTVLAVAWMIYEWHKKATDYFEFLAPPTKPFSVSEYLGRMEQAQLDILEDQKPVDQTVILWWGLDGLTLDENGELKWISRKKPESPIPNVFFQPCQSVLYADNYPIDMWQSTQARIDALQAQNAALQMQAAQQAQMQNIFSQVNTCCAQALAQNYPYYQYRLY